MTINARLDRFDAAKDWAERARIYAQARLGSDSREAADAEKQLAALQVRAGDEAGFETADRALGLARAAFGPAHPKTAEALFTRGNAHHQRGAYAEALLDFEAALAIEDSPVFSSAKGLSLLSLDRRAAAVETLEHAVAGFERQPTPDPERHALARFRLARALGPDSRRARTLARSALATYDALDSRKPQERATIRAWLAATVRITAPRPTNRPHR